ncbi:MAG: phosphorylase family protein [Thermoleophilia bacterium]
MATWEQKFVRFVAERWVFQGTDPHDYAPRTLILAFGEDFISPRLERHEHFGTLYSGLLGGHRVGYVKVPPGTVILEGIMRALEFTRVDHVIGLGTCGALQKEIDCGDVIVADSAKAGDCMSLHYGFDFNQVIPADKGLTVSLSDFLSRRGMAVHSGPIVTTGAVLRETEQILAEWNRDGYLGVELEASALFALSNWMKMKSTIALLVTDSPVRQETSGELHGRKREAFVQGIIDYIGSPEMTV